MARADSGRKGSEREERSDPDVTILGTAHNAADARLHRLCAALLRAGLRVEVIARGSADDAPKPTLFVGTPKRGIIGRGVQAMVFPVRARGPVVLTMDPDLVPAARLRRALARGTRLVVDVQEDYVTLLADRAWARGVVGVIAKAWAHAAVALARGADMTVVADDHVPPLTAVNRLVVRNMPDLGMLPKAGVQLDGVPRALYIGDVRESRGLFTMLRMIELAPDWHLDIVGPVAARDEARLSEWQATSGAASRVRLHGRMPPKEAWKLAPGAWAGISLLHSTPAFEDAMPSKIYEYFTCGLPVLTTPIRRAAQLVEQAAAGAVVADPEAAAAALNGWSSTDRGGFELCRKAAVGWSERTLAEPSPYDRFAAAVVDLVAQTRPDRAAPVPTATNEAR